MRAQPSFTAASVKKKMPAGFPAKSATATPTATGVGAASAPRSRCSAVETSCRELHVCRERALRARPARSVEQRPDCPLDLRRRTRAVTPSDGLPRRRRGFNSKARARGDHRVERARARRAARAAMLTWRPRADTDPG